MQLQSIYKIGNKTIELLNKLGIYNCLDLIQYYPYRYNIYKPTFIEDVLENTQVTINATIESSPKIVYMRKNFNLLQFQVLAGNKMFQVVIYNRSFLYNKLDIGKNITLVGKYDKKKNKFIASDLKLSWTKEMKIEPIYHIVKGIKNYQLNSFILEALNYEKDIPDYIPFYLAIQYHFIQKSQALKYIHQPLSIPQVKQARLRLIYEEFFIFMLKMNYLKMKNKNAKGMKKDFELEKVKHFIKTLPFSLTEDQITATKDILNDLRSEYKMNRLIQGDVGSGKTIVATIAMYATFLAGFQSALMAPTEILAIQHYENIKSLLEPMQGKVALLVGSQKKKEREEILTMLKNGEVDVVVGTHALISEPVQFKNLGLVITDEQHRFGVNQRNNLQNKGITPDVIYMSATPIPRTYALTLYQDMDTSIIKTKPKGRKEIKTYVKSEKELKSVLKSIYEEIKKGHQIYVVAPLIEENEGNVHDVDSLKKNFERAFNGKVKIATLHGKIKNTEKEEIMRHFQENEIQILIATTVIEVGVDVRNATTMIIFNAEMYGLATLHQLRGRVGRGDEESFCYLISDSDKERLKVLEKSNDGFYISEQDFLMRKEGDLFGTRQSGDMFFKIGDLKNDFKILLQAKKDSELFLNSEQIKEEKYQKILKEIEGLD